MLTAYLPHGYARFITLDGEKAVLRFENDHFDFYVKINGTIQHILAGVPAVGEWYHVAGTHDGTTMRLYVDGVEIGSRAVSGTVATGTGVQINSGNERFDGLLDDVRVYDRALSPCEIALLAAGDAADGTPQALIQRSHEITGEDPLFVNAGAGDYSLQAASPAVDTGEPLAPVPVGGGSVADMGYREVLAVPLTLLFGAEGTTCAEGNSGMASVEVGISHVHRRQPAADGHGTVELVGGHAQHGRRDRVLLERRHHAIRGRRAVPALQPGRRRGRQRQRSAVRQLLHRRRHRPGGRLDVAGRGVRFDQLTSPSSWRRRSATTCRPAPASASTSHRSASKSTASRSMRTGWTTAGPRTAGWRAASARLSAASAARWKSLPSRVTGPATKLAARRALSTVVDSGDSAVITSPRWPATPTTP